MEYASFLAGERWTDHPRCTHPLLAGVARAVNDQISDTARPKLVALIPSVIGLNGADPRVDAGIAIRCAAIALPVVAEQRQRALAAGLISARRVVAELEPSAMDLTAVLDQAHIALMKAPKAAQWAAEFTAGTYLTPRALQRRSAPCIVRVAVIGISEACIPDPDAVLHDLLTAVISDCTGWLGAESPERATPEPAASPKSLAWL
jgi:hypothetical protein